KYRYVYAQHLNYFSARTLGQLGRSTGFAIVATRFLHFNPVVVLQDWRRRGREVSNQERGDLLQRTTAWKQRRVLKPVKALYRATEAILARLKLADNLVVVLRKD